MRPLALIFVLILAWAPPASAQYVEDGKVCWEGICNPLYRENDDKKQIRPALPNPPHIAAPSAQSRPQVEERVAFQVSRNDPALMGLTLSNAQNVIEHYGKLGRVVKIEIVAYGPGLHLMRADNNPVRERVAALVSQHPQRLKLSACSESVKEQAATEGHTIELLKGVELVDLGIARLIALQEAGFKSLRP